MDPKLGSLKSRGHDPDKVFSQYKALQCKIRAYEAIHHSLKKKKPSGWNKSLFQDAACDLYKQQRGSSFKSFEAWQYLCYQPQVPQKLKEDDRNYTAMHTHV
jgi:hypothetical protein